MILGATRPEDEIGAGSGGGVVLTLIAAHALPVHARRTLTVGIDNEVIVQHHHADLDDPCHGARLV